MSLVDETEVLLSGNTITEDSGLSDLPPCAGDLNIDSPVSDQLHLQPHHLHHQHVLHQHQQQFVQQQQNMHHHIHHISQQSLHNHHHHLLQSHLGEPLEKRHKTENGIDITETSLTPGKKARGRPRKYAPGETPTEKKKQSMRTSLGDSPSSEKKGRGRPRKYAPGESPTELKKKETVPKIGEDGKIIEPGKKRGRPPAKKSLDDQSILPEPSMLSSI